MYLLNSEQQQKEIKKKKRPNQVLQITYFCPTL